jgi:hypothetical protein
MHALLDVVKVEAQPGDVLHLTFEDGEKRIFDMSSCLGKQPFVVTGADIADWIKL